MMRSASWAVAVPAVATVWFAYPPVAGADNTRLNNSVVAGVYTVRYHAGCASPDIAADRALVLAAQRHARDVVNHPQLHGDIGSDGSTPELRSAAAGFVGAVSQTVAVNPALAINNLDVITRWYHDPVAVRIMSDCSNTAIGVWSENSLNRSVVVAVYGRAG